jgi:hypothetical protein
MDNTVLKSEILKDFNGIVLVNKKRSMTTFDIIRHFKKFFF